LRRSLRILISIIAASRYFGTFLTILIATRRFCCGRECQRRRVIRRSGRAADLVSVEALHDRPEGACDRTAVSRTSGSASERRRCGRTHPCPAASPLCLHRRRQEPNAVSKGRDCGQRQHGAGGRGRRGRTAVLELFVLHPEVVPLLVAKLLGRGGGRSAAAPAQFLQAHNGRCQRAGAQRERGRGDGGAPYACGHGCSPTATCARACCPLAGRTAAGSALQPRAERGVELCRRCPGWAAWSLRRRLGRLPPVACPRHEERLSLAPWRHLAHACGHPQAHRIYQPAAHHSARQPPASIGRVQSQLPAQVARTHLGRTRLGCTNGRCGRWLAPFRTVGPHVVKVASTSRSVPQRLHAHRVGQNGGPRCGSDSGGARASGAGRGVLPDARLYCLESALRRRRRAHVAGMSGVVGV